MKLVKGVKLVKRGVRCDTWRRSVEPDVASGAGEAGAGAMEEVMGRMAGLKVRGTTAAAGYLVFSVINFVQGARQDTATYAAATLWWRGLRESAAYAEHLKGHVVMVRLARGDCTYRTEAMSLRGLQTLLLVMGSHVEPEFRREFEGILAGIA